ncbi:hypothetical protein [Paraburkholderia domus]|uniref:hypothetical protein n=1 Tax=Paraburkholderia domus TaxID=2793075 RepID=UPI0019136BEF|nr:hypothetical protein [Paraburkholderia domus]MBK5054400.1 hypothetical protein [Burkholderia sp. R-70006]MBK5066086.1 hypothetical protein [Burkholderia sp. R-70199]MBK5169738.1 hypothetical protein [Burkholderia sp. R-70211]MBK5185439.1 hypothetical protein [Burkholderia sp. R-69749]
MTKTDVQIPVPICLLELVDSTSVLTRFGDPCGRAPQKTGISAEVDDELAKSLSGKIIV